MSDDLLTNEQPLGLLKGRGADDKPDPWISVGSLYSTLKLTLNGENCEWYLEKTLRTELLKATSVLKKIFFIVPEFSPEENISQTTLGVNFHCHRNHRFPFIHCSASLT